MRAAAVYGLGLLWAVLSLVGFTWLSESHDINLMGYYISFLPFGALFGGVLGGTGFGLASKSLGLRISKKQVYLIALSFLCAYWAERYAEYLVIHPVFKDTQEAVPFWAYTDYVARHWTFSEEGKAPGAALGKLGYLVLFAENAGFILGGIVVPAIVRELPYCWHCDHYMKTRTLGHLAASIPYGNVVVTDKAAVEAHGKKFQEALDKAQEHVDRLKLLAKEGRGMDFNATLNATKRSDKAELPIQVRVNLQECPACHSGRVKVETLTKNGEKVETSLLFEEQVVPTFVNNLA